MTNTQREERPERPVESDGTAHLFRALGRQLKFLREQAGMSQRELAQATHCGEDLISAMERGVRTPQVEFLALADRALKTGGLLSSAAEEVREALGRVRTRHPGWFRDYARTEAEAVAVHGYSAQAIPGLLQTEAYARATFIQRRPLLSEETIEKRVADRLARQQVFERWPPPTFSYVLEETALRRPLGGRDVHAEQLRRIMHFGRLRNVEIQVMPTDREEHAALDGTFTLIDPKGRPQVAYTELYGKARLITDQNEVRVYSERYGIIRAQALSPRESLTFIEKVLGDR
ncbi:helix-turn-helix domain-containing protein [Streptomyces sp. NBC_00525]|uniref:helix-turn-helix domain-containing protein n=1 Tax=Streptomyces sp. NBC_00525 TaxID=2903660 RepID=UPI002E8180A9|nr:helix-turn-helix transcriptional regulator [Streptomyces sp. NBC_00525]WUC94221.1 helix-turn-helix transcriptional regulator [Streptomyces sp. NBC_00525]